MAMSSEVDISNEAIALCGGRGFISDLGESSAEARYCNRFYDSARDFTLEDVDWDFASARSDLNLLTEDPMPGWKYAYSMPNHCIAPREILPVYAGSSSEYWLNEARCDGVLPARRRDKIPFQVVMNEDKTKKVVVTDKQDAVLRYTYRVENPALYPAMMTQALSAYLAVKICIPLTRDKDLMSELVKHYEKLKHAAIASNRNQQQSDEEPLASWHEARQ